MLLEMRIIGVELVICESIVQKSQNSSEAFQRLIHMGGLYILKEIRTSLSEGT